MSILVKFEYDCDHTGLAIYNNIASWRADLAAMKKYIQKSWGGDWHFNNMFLSLDDFEDMFETHTISKSTAFEIVNVIGEGIGSFPYIT